MVLYIGFNETGFPKWFIYLCFVLCFIQNIILCLFRVTGIFSFVEYHDRDHQKQFDSSHVSAVLTRELLVVTTFKDIQRKDLLERCAVCLNDFVGDDKIRCLQNCTHIFHQGCLDRWMEQVQGTCPIWRTPILPYACQEEYNKRLKICQSSSHLMW